jgi:hypothetical protein
LARAFAAAPSLAERSSKDIGFDLERIGLRAVRGSQNQGLFLFVYPVRKGSREMMKIGYGRVSTNGQSLEAQEAELQSAGVDKIFKEKASGAETNRPQLAKAIGSLQKGDLLVVTRLDRLARSTRAAGRPSGSNVPDVPAGSYFWLRSRPHHSSKSA